MHPLTQYKTMQKWIDANPDYMEDPRQTKIFYRYGKKMWSKYRRYR